ncbi:helix-turn-helix transcriptional regulator [Bacteroidales bacterium OttesenSCG-928-J16]|nr:helix-turn-helix transcriptional regulator [Bacteroidales bacterium OttesenSCG-928-J16]
MKNGSNIEEKKNGLNIHIGQLIKAECLRQNMRAERLADAISCERANVYKLFNKRHINADLLFKISQTLHYDFFAVYSKKLDINPPEEFVHVLVDVRIPAKELKSRASGICDYCEIGKIG